MIAKLTKSKLAFALRKAKNKTRSNSAYNLNVGKLWKYEDGLQEFQKQMDKAMNYKENKDVSPGM